MMDKNGTVIEVGDYVRVDMSINHPHHEIKGPHYGKIVKANDPWCIEKWALKIQLLSPYTSLYECDCDSIIKLTDEQSTLILLER